MAAEDDAREPDGPRGVLIASTDDVLSIPLETEPSL